MLLTFLEISEEMAVRQRCAEARSCDGCALCSHWCIEVQDVEALPVGVLG
jgi:hypothetical protein